MGRRVHNLTEEQRSHVPAEYVVRHMLLDDSPVLFQQGCERRSHFRGDPKRRVHELAKVDAVLLPGRLVFERPDECLGIAQWLSRRPS